MMRLDFWQRWLAQLSCATSVTVAVLLLAERFRPGSVAVYLSLPLVILTAGVLAVIASAAQKFSRGVQWPIIILLSAYLFFIVGQRGVSGFIFWSMGTLLMLAMGWSVAYAEED